MVPTAHPDKASRPKRKADSGSRFGMLNRFVDLTLRRIDATAAVVWLVLFRDTKPDGLVRTGQADLARRIGLSDRTVRTALRQLERLGLLVVVKRGRLGIGATVYRVRAGVKDDQ
jgi:predicted DNA-binding transcriptional regulator